MNIEGLSRQLAPEFNLWASASPQIEKWLRKQVGVFSFLKRIRNNLPMWSEQLPEIPGMIYEVLRETKRQQEQQRFEQANLTNGSANHITRTKILYFSFGAFIAILVAEGVSYWLQSM